MRNGDPHRLLEQAFTLADLGRGSVEPNPRVGALVLAAGALAGRGHHAEYGGAHAEVAALAEAALAGRKPDEMVVTLEPCSTHGKTPPCVEAILRAGIRKITIGATDPNPAHRGRGIAILRDHGLEVIHGGADARFREQNRPFLRSMQRERPWILAKWAMTLDGRSALTNGDSQWISSERSRARVHRLRGRCEGVAVGVSTILRDDPLLTCRGEQLLAAPPARIIFDTELRTPPEARVITNREAPTWILTIPGANPARRLALERLGAVVVETPPEIQQNGAARVDVAAAAKWLYSMGVRRLLVEAGPVLVGALRAANLIDQVICIIAPKIAGAALAPPPSGAPEAPRMNDAWQLEDVYVERIGDDTLIGGFLDIPA